MTDEEMDAAYLYDKRVKVENHDYKFEGVIIALVQKRNKKWRCVVENDDGVCLIQSAKNLVLA